MRALVSLLLVLVAAPAFAQDYDKASQLYSAAVDAYARGKFSDAAVQFAGAYEVTKDPVLLFNLGKAYESGQDFAGAVSYYRKYLGAVPAATDKAELEKRVAELAKKYHLEGELALPQPPAELAPLKRYLGVWRCVARDRAPARLGGDHDAEGYFIGKLDLDGFALAGRYQERKSKTNPAPLTQSLTVTWDPAAKKLVRADLDSFGGAASLSSTGVEGDKQVWTGEQLRDGQKVLLRHAVEFKRAQELEWLVDEQANGGDWSRVVQASCKRKEAAPKK